MGVMGSICTSTGPCGVDLGSELSRAMLCGSNAQIASVLRERELCFQCGGGVNSAVYDGSSRRVVSGDEMGEIKVWDLITCQARSSMSCKSPVNAVLCVPELKAIATGDDSGAVILWDAASSQPRLTISSGALPVRALLYAPGPKALLAACSGRGIGNVMALDATSGQRTLKFLCEESPLSICHVPDQSAVAAGNGKLVSVWDLSTGEKRWEVEPSDSPVIGVAHAGDLQVVISGDQRGEVVLWEAASGARRHTFRCSVSNCVVLAMAYATHLSAVVVATTARDVRAYCAVSGSLLSRLSCGYSVHSIHYAEALQSLILGHHLEGKRLSSLVSPSGRTGMVKILPLSKDTHQSQEGPEAPLWVDQAPGQPL